MVRCTLAKNIWWDSQMDINVKLLSDVADATDKLADVTGKTGGMILKAVGTGYKIADFKRVRELADKLADLLGLTKQQRQSQQLDFVPALDLYLSRPDDRLWKSIQGQAESYKKSIDLIMFDLGDTAREIVTEDFYDELNLTLGARQRQLEILSNISPPHSKDELDELKRFTENYKLLITNLGIVNKAIAEYINALKRDNVWPT